MFGGIGFLVNGIPLFGVRKEALVARLGADEGEAALRKPYVKEFDGMGRSMRTWVRIEPAGVEDDV